MELIQKDSIDKLAGLIDDARRNSHGSVDYYDLSIEFNGGIFFIFVCENEVNTSEALHYLDNR